MYSNTTEPNPNHNKNPPNAAQLHQITDRREDGETAWERTSWHGGTADVQSRCGELASAPDGFTVNHGGTSNVGGEEQKIQDPWSPSVQSSAA